MSKRIAVFPGTFDPFTNGHLDIVLKALKLFEEVIIAIQNDHLLGIVNGKESKYSHQQIFVVFIDGYTYAVPFVEDNHHIFLKTIYPSRVLHKKYYEDLIK